jgi:hypothetical protein
MQWVRGASKCRHIWHVGPQSLVTHRDQPDVDCGVERRESLELRDNIPVAINERSRLGILPLIGALVVDRGCAVTLLWPRSTWT